MKGGQKCQESDADLTIFGYRKDRWQAMSSTLNQALSLSLKPGAAANVPAIRSHVKKGIVLSGDQFISSQEKKEQLCADFKKAPL